MKLYNQAVLIGCDANQEWMLQWWFNNYKTHNNLPVIFADFGVSAEALNWVKKQAKEVFSVKQEKEKGWFLKPKAMLKSPSVKTLWVDIDCEVRGSLTPVFKELEVDKLAMVKDHPWISRRGELWHNSGVVGIVNKPTILKDWILAVGNKPHIGDQEVLHSMLNPITKIRYIKDLPHKYNVLRIDIDDNNVPQDPVIVHWTGSKGKDEIRRQMNA